MAESVKQHPKRALKRYKNMHASMNFLFHLTLMLYSIHDFPDMNQALDIDLWLYEVANEDDPNLAIKLFRMGTNPNIMSQIT